MKTIVAHDRLDALVRLTERVAEAGPLGELLSGVVEEARRLLEATAAGLRVAGGHDLTRVAWVGERPELGGPARLAVGVGLDGLVATTAAPVRIPDLQVEPRPQATGYDDLIAGGIRA